MTRIAAIDAGSNAIRFIAADFRAPSSYDVVHVDPLKLALLPANRLDAVILLLSAMTVRERIDELRLRPDRADVILPAALVYRHCARLARTDHVVVAGVGVKEGVLLDVARGAG